MRKNTDPYEKVGEERDEVKEAPKKSVFSKVQPPILIGAGIIIFFLIRSMNMVEEAGEKDNTYIIGIIIIVAILYFLSKQEDTGAGVLSPKEAEMLVEEECMRKIQWNQFPAGTKFMMTPINNLIHRDARGMYYHIGVAFKIPYDKTKYYFSKVMMKGPERGFVSFIESINPIHGREIPQEKSFVPSWWKAAGKDQNLMDLFRKKGGW